MLRQEDRPYAKAADWAALAERGAYWGIRFLGAVYRRLGRRACLVAMAPVILYFYLTGREQRRASQDYLRRLWRAGHLPREPGHRLALRHHLAFGEAVLDKLAAWLGDMRAVDIDGIEDGLFAAAKRDPRGAFVISAHLGNPEIIRAVATLAHRHRINVLVHTIHAQSFNRLIERFSPLSPVRMIQVTRSIWARRSSWPRRSSAASGW